MYSILVLQGGIAPDYVLDRMEYYEMDALIDYMYLKNKESWEQARTVSYFTAQCQSTKKIDMKEMMPFPWEKDIKEAPDSTKEERERIMEEMRQIKNQMNSNG